MFENVNIKGNSYEIGDIIRSFHEQTAGCTSNEYVVNRILDEGGVVPSKLCYEAVKPFSNYEDVFGLSFCFGGIRPYYVTYRALLHESALIIASSNSIIRNIISGGKGQKCIIPNVNPYVIESYIYELSNAKVDNFNEYVGKLVSSNHNNCIIVDNMSVKISHNDLTQGITDMLGQKDKDITKIDIYTSINKRISDKRKTGKDLNWFMYKVILLNKIM